MKTKFTLKSLLLLCALIVGGAGSAWAADETIAFSELGLTNSTQYSTINGTDCTLTFGDGSNDGKYYNTGAAIRVYGGGHMTVASTTKTITKIELTFGSGDGSNEITTDVNTYSNGTWTGSASSVKFTVGGTSGHRRIASVAVTYATGGDTPTLDDNNLTLSPVALSFDLYNNVTAQVINYTTSSTGAVTVSASEFINATVDAVSKTITVTPIKKTSGAVEIMVSQAADDTYKAGSATFSVTITDSTPFAGGDITFDATIDKGTSPLTKSEVTFTCSSGVLNNGSEYRLYKNSVTTFSLSDDVISSGYKITNITFSGVSGNPASGFGTQEGWATDGNDGTWTGEATSVSFTASGAQVRATQIVITVEIPAPKVLSSIALSGDYPTIFHVGGAFSHEGMTVTANYEGGKTTDVTAEATFTGYDMAASGTQTVTVSYTEGEVTKTATYEITVKVPATLTSITLSGTYPTEFQQGDSFSSEGIVVTANYDDDTTVDVTEDATFSGYDMSTLGDQTVTVTYNGKTATYDITVVEKKGTEDNPYTVAQARAAIDANAGVTGVYVTGIVSEIVTAYSSQYGNITYNISTDGTTTADQLQAYRGMSYNGDNFTSEDDIKVGDVVVVYGNLTKYNSTYEFAANNQLVSLVRPVVTTPSISLSTKTINATAASEDGTIEVTYNNIATVIAEVKFYEADGQTEATYDWVEAAINPQTNNVDYVIGENTSTEVRTAYLKVYALDDEANDVYSELITITQAEPVVDYATLPFEFENGSSAIASTKGLTQSGLGSDYKSAPLLKFDTTGDYMVLKLNEAPGRIAFDIKGNSFSDGTFTVQTSADGVTYTDLESYTDLGDTQSESLLNNDTNVRYIKWIYTEKVNGNVGLGNIKVTKVVKKSISAAGYATFCSEYPLDFTGSGLTAYIATMSSTTVSFTPVTTVPANTGLLLKGEAGEKSISVIAGDDVENVSANVLEGVLTDTQKDAGIFVLMNGESGVGFYKTNNAFIVGANTAYLPATASARTFIGFSDDTTTGISATQMNDVNSEVYDLQGRRVAQPQRGLYIVNGKKVVVK